MLTQSSNYVQLRRAVIVFNAARHSVEFLILQAQILSIRHLRPILFLPQKKQTI
jgi:hypothetical protein